MPNRQPKQPVDGDVGAEPIELNPEIIEALDFVYGELKKVRDPDRRQELEGLGVFIK